MILKQQSFDIMTIIIIAEQLGMLQNYQPT